VTMAEKDLDEQFAAIMAHWDEEARGLDPFGDPAADADDGPHDAGPNRASDEPRRPADDAPFASGPAVAPSAGNPAPARDDMPREVPGPSTPSDDESRPSRPSQPGQPSRAPGEADRGGRDDDHGPDPDPGEPRPKPVAGSAWRRHDPAEVDEHFEPPPPAPLPSSEDKHFWTMLGALIGGPLLFIYLLLFNRDGNGWWMTFALLASVAGFVLLVLRQPNDRDDDDDGVRL